MILSNVDILNEIEGGGLNCPIILRRGLKAAAPWPVWEFPFTRLRQRFRLSSEANSDWKYPISDLTPCFSNPEPLSAN